MSYKHISRRDFVKVAAAIGGTSLVGLWVYKNRIKNTLTNAQPELIPIKSISIPVTNYELRDDFTDKIAAGSLNGTQASPTGEVRTATDTEMKMAVASGQLTLGSKAAPAWGNPGLWYPVISRVAGRTMITKVNLVHSLWVSIGYSTNTAGEAIYGIKSTNSGAIRLSNIITDIARMATTGYYLASMTRATGMHYFIKGGTFPNWTLLYPLKTGSEADLYPSITDYNSSATVEFVRIPSDLIIISPLASDGFTRSNGSIGSTDGQGAEESGGAGLEWNNQSGRWVISSNQATASTSGISTVPCGSGNVMIDAALTWTTGNVGIVARYTDANNYMYAYHDGHNAVLVKVVTGAHIVLINAAAAYEARGRLVLSAHEAHFRLYYADKLIGTEQSIADPILQTGASHGLYTSGEGNAINDFVVWPRGNAGEYDALFDKYIPGSGDPDKLTTGLTYHTSPTTIYVDI